MSVLDAAILGQVSKLSKDLASKELGGLPINTFKSFYVDATVNKLIDTYGATWLKTGVVEDLTSDYVDATRGPLLYSGESFSVVAQSTSSEDITWDGAFFWVVDRISSAIYNYNSDGVYQNISFLNDKNHY